MNTPPSLRPQAQLNGRSACLNPFAQRTRGSLQLAITALAFATMMLSAPAQVQTAGTLFVNLDATALSPGALADITNSGSLGGYFETNGVTGSAYVTNLNGVNSIYLNLGYMTLRSGILGALVPPPSGLCGANPTASIEVWAFNAAIADDACMVAWGVRTNQLMAFEYGTNVNFGCVQHVGTRS